MSISCKKIIFTILCCFIALHSASAANQSKAVTWLNNTADFSIDKIFTNISRADGMPGAVIASPSRNTPDYYYHWVRDAALTMLALQETYRTSDNPVVKTKIEQVMSDYLDFSTHIQNNSSNLGEPKFYVDGHAYEKPWGRPQHDGPALRAISLIEWSHILITSGKISYVKEKLYRAALPADTPIKKDLEYISHHWKEPSFDIWEEVKGTHFYTLMVIRRALIQGADLADFLDDHGAAKWYRLQAKEIEFELQNFWDEEKGYITATINRSDGIDYKTSDLDTAVLLGLMHGHMRDGFLSWDNPHVIATMKALGSTFAKLYSINRYPHVAGIAIGRYPEDLYNGEKFDGGNPWPLCTLALAEAWYRYANLLRSQGESVAAKEAASRADQFVERVKYHAYPDGALDEQIDRRTGFMTSARDLTWNYAAVLTTRAAAAH